MVVLLGVSERGEVLGIVVLLFGGGRYFSKTRGTSRIINRSWVLYFVRCICVWLFVCCLCILWSRITELLPRRPQSKGFAPDPKPSQKP